MTKKLIAFLLILFSASAGAHCPTHFQPENICLMLDQNIIYIYDQKGEHNGPYQDLKASSLESVKADGLTLKFSHADRGIYKIDSAVVLKSVNLEVMNAKKKIALKLSAH